MAEVVISGHDSPAAPLPASRRMSEGAKLLLFAVMAFGQFMALLDIQIVAASLNNIQAGLNAGPEEISWVQTAYLMAEIVMIPLSGFLSQALSTRWLFAGSAALFTLASMACGFAWDIQSMIVFRAIQGFVGGAMIPTVFSAGFSMFEGKRAAMIPAILGMVSTLAPTLGPTVGGWITGVADWRWLFFMNVGPGVLITLLVPILGRIDEPNLSMLKKIDWAHLIGLAVCLGSFQYMLEQGPQHEWFNDVSVTTAAWLAFVGLLLFLERSFFSKFPLVKLTAFKRRTFAVACALNVAIGFGLYGATYLMPIFLGRVRGYDSLEIGTTVFVTGIAMFFSAPLAARATTFLDQRIVIAIGFCLFALGLWLTSAIGPEWGFWQLLIPQLVRGFSILLCIVPSVGMAMNGLQGPELRYGSGLFNLTRNLGGAIGIALANTWLGDNARLHVLRISEGMGQAAQAGSEMLRGLAAQMPTVDPVRAMEMAQGAMGRVVGRQALTLAFDDVFRMMAFLFLFGLLLIPLADRTQLRDGPPVSEH
jgi:DHA2 family multidrug resistance protein